MKTYKFEEPHETGGIASITIDEDKILTYMRRKFPSLAHASDKRLIEDFVSNHWAKEVISVKQGWQQCNQCGNGGWVTDVQLEVGDINEEQPCSHCGYGTMTISWNDDE